MWTAPFAAKNLFPTMHILAPLPGYKLVSPALRHVPRRSLCCSGMRPEKLKLKELPGKEDLSYSLRPLPCIEDRVREAPPVFNLWLRVLSTHGWGESKQNRILYA